MKKLAIAIAAIALIGTPAFAADMAVKAPPPPLTPAFSWTGFYGGFSLGARWAENDWTTTGFGPITTAAGARPGSDAQQSYDSIAARIGGYAGYNWQIAPTWVVGAEADLGWANNNKTKIAIPGTTHVIVRGVPQNVDTSGDTSSVDERWDGSVRARVGFLVTPTTLLYGTGGVAWQQVELRATCTVNATFTSFCSFPLVPTTHVESVSTTMIGWTLGVGFEQMVWKNWLFRAEYRYGDFGNLSHLFFGSDIGLKQDDQIFAKVHVTTQTAIVGFAYKL